MIASLFLIASKKQVKIFNLLLYQMDKAANSAYTNQMNHFRHLKLNAGKYLEYIRNISNIISSDEY
ncbi:hypothetical protein ACRRVC_01765 [Candidatus Cardinium hertigii]